MPPEARRWAAGARPDDRGALLEHLPRDRREARTVAELQAGEQATVAVEVRSIAARPVRRRGMRPLVEAVVFDATGAMRATFFNQPWLVQRYPPGTRLVLHGKTRRGAVQGLTTRSARISAPTPRGRDRLDGEIGSLPGDGGRQLHSDPDAGARSPRPRLRHAGAAAAASGWPSACPTARRAGGDALRAQRRGARGGPRAAGLRGAAADAARVPAPALQGRSGRARSRWPGAALSARWLAELLPFALTGDQRGDRGDRRGPRAVSPMQRLLMGEVGSGKTVVALHALLRAVEHGCRRP